MGSLDRALPRPSYSTSLLLGDWRQPPAAAKQAAAAAQALSAFFPVHPRSTTSGLSAPRLSQQCSPQVALAPLAKAPTPVPSRPASPVPTVDTAIAVPALQPGRGAARASVRALPPRQVPEWLQTMPLKSSASLPQIAGRGVAPLPSIGPVAEVTAADVEEAFSDEEPTGSAELFRLCFWPIYVWKRIIRTSRIERELAEKIAYGLLRQHIFRQWTKCLPPRRARIAALLERQAQIDATNHQKRLERLREATARYYHRAVPAARALRVSRGTRFASLRARILGYRPFLALWVYARCRAQVLRVPVHECRV